MLDTKTKTLSWTPDLSRLLPTGNVLLRQDGSLGLHGMSLGCSPAAGRTVLRILLLAFFPLALEKHRVAHFFDTCTASELSNLQGSEIPTEAGVLTDKA